MSDPVLTPSVFRDPAPVGRGDYLVRPGECLQSIAADHGFFWETIWNFPDNSEVKSTRKDPMVIQAGDRLAIPEIDPGGEEKPDKKRHRFRRKGVPAVLKFQMLHEGEPRRNEPWILDLDGKRLEGTTDGEGRFNIVIPPGAQRGILRVGEGVHETVQQVELGHLEPFDTVLGVQQRLTNLGFYEGLEDGTWSEGIRRAIDAFLVEHDGQTEAELSEATLEKIRDAHGS
ncbi:MAG: LysM domain-containing protein [Leptolyngbya sp. PLA3]|nr:MAG: LysM domain-containing protein [Cyanobacteria bacterium CYA]MCE7967544.1 LysM domain-containing protein [Leptolyngbya sp. PL-A3]